jgi:serine/threonine protein kinase HipA of HipAB toxin-antitoxin module
MSKVIRIDEEVQAAVLEKKHDLERARRRPVTMGEALRAAVEEATGEAIGRPVKDRK